MMESPAILIDTTRCTGCDRCVAACKAENELGPDRLRAGQRRVDDLSATRFSTVRWLEGDHYVRQQCRHCLEPACVSACLVGAMQKTPEGPVIHDGPYGLPLPPAGLPSTSRATTGKRRS
jgi:formate dehydrogenase iron-sulfur subunit